MRKNDFFCDAVCEIADFCYFIHFKCPVLILVGGVKLSREFVFRMACNLISYNEFGSLSVSEKLIVCASDVKHYLLLLLNGIQ